MQKALQVDKPGRLLWAQMGSNHRPPDYESPLFDVLSDPNMLGYLSYVQH